MASRDLSVPKKLTLETYRRRQKIGAALRELRERNDISVTDAASMASVSFLTWKRWESGKTAIPLELVAEISKALTGVAAALKPFLQAA